MQIESAAPDLDRRNRGAFVSVGGRRPGRVIYGTCLVGCDRPGPARAGHVQPQRQIGGSRENARRAETRTLVTFLAGRGRLPSLHLPVEDPPHLTPQPDQGTGMYLDDVIPHLEATSRA